MNGQPHTHELNIQKIGSYWTIEYGDQRVFVSAYAREFYRGPFWDRRFDRQLMTQRLEARARDVIAYHDAASLVVGRDEAMRAKILSKLAPARTNQWASDQLEQEQHQ